MPYTLEQKQARARKLHKKGICIDHIAKHLNVKPATVEMWLRDA